jgi:hypothetical protein
MNMAGVGAFPPRRRTDESWLFPLISAIKFPGTCFFKLDALIFLCLSLSNPIVRFLFFQHCNFIDPTAAMDSRGEGCGQYRHSLEEGTAAA